MRPDLPGFGGSPLPEDEPDLDVVVEAVVAMLREAGTGGPDPLNVDLICRPTSRSRCASGDPGWTPCRPGLSRSHKLVTT